jgi:LuxR family maltose regulon positive regulatory protein
VVAPAAATVGLSSELPLLASKLRPPPAHTGLIPRPGVLRRLNAARRTRLVVVEAPAGYGKTTALAEWARSDRRLFGWYAADELDDDPLVFLAYLAAALSTVGAGVDAAVARLAAARGSRRAVVAELGRALAALTEPAVIVLDDLHRLPSDDWLDAVGVLAERVPAHSQLVLATRAALDVDRFDVATAGGKLALGREDLRLSDPEAAALLRANGMDVSEDDMSLQERCDGWPTGLYLAALAVRGAGRASDPSPLGADRHIVDFFRLEVLDQLAAEDREFLLEVSVVDRVCGSLCDAILGRPGSAARLASLAKANAFLDGRDDGDGWFALHPLFRETLQAELEHRHGGLRKALLVRASDWFEARGDTDTAIERAIEAGDGNRVAALCTRALLPAYRSGRFEAVERWCVAVDDVRLLTRHPAVAALGSALHALEGRPEAAERWARAFYETDARTVMPDGSRADAWIAALRALLAQEGVEAMREDAELAAAALTRGSPLAPGAHLLLGFARALAGDDVRAADAFVAAADAGTRTGASVTAATVPAALAVVAAQRGDVREAEEHARRAHALVEAAHLEDHVTTAYGDAACARVSLLRGRRSAARRHLARADRLVSRLTHVLPWLAAPVRLELAQLQLELANPARARELLDEIDEILVRRPGFDVVAERAARVRHDLDGGRPTDGEWGSLLTGAELRLLPLLASHLSFREIAERLAVSRNTVKTQAIAVYRKLGVSSRSEAVAKAAERGILAVPVAPRAVRTAPDHPNGTMS